MSSYRSEFPLTVYPLAGAGTWICRQRFSQVYILRAPHYGAPEVSGQLTAVEFATYIRNKYRHRMGKRAGRVQVDF